MDVTRRRMLATTAGIVGTGVLAGCTDGSTADAGSDGTTTQSSFFVFGDAATNVAGEVATAELLVPVGQHGHGWEPGPSVREDIHTADLFVHGMAGFQPWVDDVLGDLDADGADVATVDASAGLDLLEVDGGDHDGTEDDHDGTADGHDETEDSHDGTEDGHNHGEVDPHFWLDPLRVKEAVGTVEGAFADVDGDNAEAYAENAERYRAELDDLHERIAEIVADTTTETLLVAGHDSFGYLGDRYDVHVEALTGLSPDDQPTQRDIGNAQEIIAEHDLQYVCADPLESQQAAEQLVAETDAEEVLPLTAMPGLTEEWAANDWGYVEVMENVNIPTLERVFDA